MANIVQAKGNQATSGAVNKSLEDSQAVTNKTLIKDEVGIKEEDSSEKKAKNPWRLSEPVPVIAPPETKLYPGCLKLYPTSKQSFDDILWQPILNNEIKTSSHFIQHSIHKSHFGSFEIEKIRSGHDMRWDGNLPYFNMGRIAMICDHGPYREKKKRKEDISNENNSDEPIEKRKYIRIQPSKKKECPASCRIHHHVYFPAFKINKDNQYHRREARKKLLKALMSDKAVEMEHTLVYDLAALEDHKFHIPGETYARPPRVRTAGKKRKNFHSQEDPMKNIQDMPKIVNQKCLRLDDPRQKYKVPPKVGSLKYRRQELRKNHIKSLQTKTHAEEEDEPWGLVSDESTDKTKQENLGTFKVNLTMYIKTLCKSFLSFETEVEVKCNIHLNIDKGTILEFDLIENISNQLNSNVPNCEETLLNKGNVQTSKNPNQNTCSHNDLMTDNSQHIKAEKIRHSVKAARLRSKRFNLNKNQPNLKSQNKGAAFKPPTPRTGVQSQVGADGFSPSQKWHDPCLFSGQMPLTYGTVPYANVNKSVPMAQPEILNNTVICPSIQTSTLSTLPKDSSHGYLAQTHPEYPSFSFYHPERADNHNRRVPYPLQHTHQTDDKILTFNNTFDPNFKPGPSGVDLSLNPFHSSETRTYWQ